jgi:hypothetical protein
MVSIISGGFKNIRQNALKTFFANIAYIPDIPDLP